MNCIRGTSTHIFRFEGKCNIVCRITLLVLSTIGGIIAFYTGLGWGATLDIPLWGLFFNFWHPFHLSDHQIYKTDQQVTAKDLSNLEDKDEPKKD